MIISITPSHIIEFLYCPRYTYFEYVLCIPQYEEKYYKVLKGREIHNKKLEENKEYLRKRIGVKNKYLDVYLTSNHLRGKVDEVLELDDGTYASLDYKFAEYNDILYNTYKIQTFCYAFLIESNFNVTVKKGFIVFTRSSNKLIEITIEEKDKQKIIESINGIEKIVINNYYPNATKYKKKCATCTYSNICEK